MASYTCRRPRRSRTQSSPPNTGSATIDQSLGLATVTVCGTSAVLSAPIVVAWVVALPTSAPEGSRIELAKITDWSLVAPFLTVTEMLTVALEVEICGVVTRVPV